MTDPFVVKEIIEPVSGKIHRVYTYNRRACKRIILKSRLCEQLAGYVLIEKDLRSVLIWLEEIDRLGSDLKAQKRSARAPDRERFNIVKGLFVAALTFYGKCFSKCEGRPVKLERTQISKEFRELHDECIAYRHNFAAHSGAKKFERVEIALVYPAKYKSQSPFQIFRELDQPDVFWPSEEDLSMQKLIEHVRSIANTKITRLSEKIRNEEVIPNAMAYWPPK